MESKKVELRSKELTARGLPGTADEGEGEMSSVDTFSFMISKF